MTNATVEGPAPTTNRSVRSFLLKCALLAVAILGEPIGAAILAWFFFSEAFTPVQLVGFFILLSGIFVAARAEKLRAIET